MLGIGSVGEVFVLHALEKVGGSVEHSPEGGFDLVILREEGHLAQDEGFEVPVDLLSVPSHVQDQVVVVKNHVDLLAEGPELEGGVLEVLEVFDDVGAQGVSVDVSDGGFVVVVGGQDAGFVSISPEVSGSPDGAVVPDSDAGVQVLHGAVEVVFCGGGDDVVVVGHEDDVMEENVIFFGTLRECFEEDAGDLPLVEAEGAVVGAAEQVVGVLCLDDAVFSCHARGRADSVPEPRVLGSLLRLNANRTLT